jgi:hypothetical protein
VSLLNYGGERTNVTIIRTSLLACPLPDPPPLAGEGTLWRKRAYNGATKIAARADGRSR